MTREEMLDMIVGEEVRVTIRFEKDITADGISILGRHHEEGYYIVPLAGIAHKFPGEKAYHINVNTPSFWINRRYLERV